MSHILDNELSYCNSLSIIVTVIVIIEKNTIIEATYHLTFISTIMRIFNGEFDKIPCLRMTVFTYSSLLKRSNMRIKVIAKTIFDS